MGISRARWFVFLACLALVLTGVRTESAWAASKKKHSSKSSKKKKPSHRATPTSGSAKPTGSAPAEEAQEGEGEDDSGDDSDDKKAEAPKAKKATKENADDAKAEHEASGEGDDADGDAPVVHKKWKRTADEGGEPAPVALELSAGPRAVHRTFDFHSPLSDFYPTLMAPYSYSLPAGPAPFVELGLYPAAFAGRGVLSHLGIIASYEKLIGTKTSFQGTTNSTSGQQLEVGLRGRLPLGVHEVGLGAAYGKHSFHVTDMDVGPGPTAVVPNVDYTFVRVGADARLRFAALSFGAHVGTRFVSDTGALGKSWFPSTKTTSIEAGVSAGYHLTPVFEVVVGGDFLRYAFDFNPVPLTNPIIAGGAVDQYISGFLALRVSISGG
jgi:hypothetical protein